MHYDNKKIRNSATVRKQTNNSTQTFLFFLIFYLFFYFLIWYIIYYIWPELVFNEIHPAILWCSSIRKKAGCPAEIAACFDVWNREAWWVVLCYGCWAVNELDVLVELPRVQSVNPELTRARGKSSKHPSWRKKRAQ